ncbi:MAG TPA: trypsin-like peptidase domain-containing protein [Candidatus Kapabacteria bacterium]|nr:trypsin-like peptidase domain-containing protein [Candidatus Kapabacteria bacterium]
MNGLVQLLALISLTTQLPACTKTDNHDLKSSQVYTNSSVARSVRDSLNDQVSNSRRNAITKAVAKASGAVVGINVTEIHEQTYYDPWEQMMQNDPFFRQFFGGRGGGGYTQRYQVKELGSGFIISPDGYILTNDHVAGKASKIIITTTMGKQYDARVINTDPVSDVCLLKIDANDLPYLQLGNSDDIDVGEWAIAMGNPFGLFEKNNKPTVTVGVVSNSGVNLGYQDGRNMREMIQTDAAISSGNSGGPLLNINGDVIGMNATIFSTAQSGMGAGSIGLGFAIPVNRIKVIVDNFRSGKSIQHNTALGFVGQTLDDNMRDQYGIAASSGVLIMGVNRGSAADQAGIQAGDVITSVNGDPVKSDEELYSIVADHKVGDVLIFNLVRGENSGTIRMKLPPAARK